MFTSSRSSLSRVLRLYGLLTTIFQLALTASPESQRAQGLTPNKAPLCHDYGNIPLSFAVNQGQSDPRVRFISRGHGYAVFLTDTSAVLTVSQGRGPNHFSQADTTLSPVMGPGSFDTVRMELVSASHSASITGADRLPGKANYFIGSEPAKWRTDVPTYAKVRYAGVYPGIDLVYYGNQGQLEYDFVVGPNVDPGAIRLQFSGAKKLTLTDQGDLAVSVQGGEIVFHKPVIYQKRNGQRNSVSGRFALLAGGTVGFSLGSYDRSSPLIIDPILVYSTYLGGTGLTGDIGYAIAVDKNGNAYVTGVTNNTDFPLKGPYQGTNKSKTIFRFSPFVTKLNAAGTALVYSTYLGGTNDDEAYAIRVDELGDAYVAGASYSGDFPITRGALQTTNRGVKAGVTNAFITKLNPAGNKLMYSTFLGGSGTISGIGDQAFALFVDSLENTYVAGGAISGDFPVTAEAFQRTNHALANYGSNAFIAKLNPAGNALIYSTYLGGGGSALAGDVAGGLAVDGSGNAFVTGSTSSYNFPVTHGAFQKTNHNQSGISPVNAFVTKLDPTGSSLVYSTYLGGSGWANSGDFGTALALDSSGYAYVTGQAFSQNFPVTAGAFQTTNREGDTGGGNAFVTKLNPSGSALVYSTYIGGSGADVANGLALDRFGNAYLAGSTYSVDFPLTTDALQTTNRGANYPSANAFVAKLNPTGNGLLYSTYLGGSKSDYANGLASDGLGDVYITGQSYSTNFPVTAGAYQAKNRGAAKGGTNLFVARLSLGSIESTVPTTTRLTSSANPQTAGVPFTLTARVAARAGTLVPAGNVVFSEDGKILSTVPLTSAGVAKLSVSTAKVGSYTYLADYRGSSRYATSSASLAETIKAPVTSPPIFSPAVGTYQTSQSVTLSDATKGAVIYYTTNETTPTTASTRYSKPIAVTKTTTIKAIAVAPGSTASAVASATYTIK